MGIFTSIYRSKRIFGNNISRYSMLLYHVKATSGKWFHFKSLVYLLLWVIIVFEVLGIEPQTSCMSGRPRATREFLLVHLNLFLHNSIDFILIYPIYNIGHFEIEFECTSMWILQAEYIWLINILNLSIFSSNNNMYHIHIMFKCNKLQALGNLKASHYSTVALPCSLSSCHHSCF